MLMTYKNRKAYKNFLYNLLTRFSDSLIYPLVKSDKEKKFNAKIKSSDVNYVDGKFRFTLKNDKHKITYIVEITQEISDKEYAKL